MNDPTMSDNNTLFFSLPDGAKLAYEILGAEGVSAVREDVTSESEPLVVVLGTMNIRNDFRHTTNALSRTRPVLLFDHRGIGHSTCSTPEADDDITIESMARDLLALLTHLGWKSLAMLGYSMGGVVIQQMLVLPYHKTNPTPIPFQIPHIILTSTRSVVLPPKYGVHIQAEPPATVQERLANARKLLEIVHDPLWLEKHQDQLNAIFSRTQVSAKLRNPTTIRKQGAALRTFDLSETMKHMPRDTEFLVIHGERDQIIPLSFGRGILDHIPWAKFIECGGKPGQIPNLAFGHAWFDYFDDETWKDVVDEFLKPPSR